MFQWGQIDANASKASIVTTTSDPYCWYYSSHICFFVIALLWDGVDK